jgi:Pyrimidine dimer DNA glycosylase
MRLWSLHPLYLDSKGLVALWREGLLAQKVLMGKTKGYKNHPQLERFKKHPDQLASMVFYLKKVCEEAKVRGYNFDESKIVISPSKVPLIKVTKGQADHEMGHLCKKLKQRDRQKYKMNRQIKKIKLHPLFKLINGGIAQWEAAGDLSR